MNSLPTKSISDETTEKSSFSSPACFGEIKQEELVNILDILKHQANTLSNSPRKVVLDHAMHICQLFLNNLLEIDWHKHLYEQAKLQNAGLNDQLTLVLKLLEFTDLSKPDPSPDVVPDTKKNSNESYDSATEKCPFQNYPDSFAHKHIKDTESTDNTEDHTAKLDVYFFGTFRIYRDDKLIECLSKSRAKQLLKYMILNRNKSIPKEVLMDRFWPDSDQGSARNNLNVAVYCLRQALKNEHSDFVHIMFQDGCYFLNPNLEIHVDTEIFEQHVKVAEHLKAQGKIAEAIENFKRAETIYQGEFLAEDLYEDWSLELREHYKFLYVKSLGKLSDFYYQERFLEDCIAVNHKIISVEIGDEHAHRRLMECFTWLNQRHLALRQYHLCAEALAKEFDLKPSQETIALYKTIRTQEIFENDSTGYSNKLHLKQA